MGVMQQCKKNVAAINFLNDAEKKKGLMIEQMFVYEFGQGCEEYLPLKNNRMKINLFDATFVRQFESIYSVIDQRIIQLLSSNSSSNAQPKVVSNQNVNVRSSSSSASNSIQ